jgi:hypothetical protein
MRRKRLRAGLAAALAACFILAAGTGGACAAVPGPQEWARLFGYLVHYDPAEARGVMYGSLFARGPEGWERVETKRFVVVRPAGPSSAKLLETSAAKWVAVEGYYGRAESNGFEVYVVNPSAYRAGRPGAAGRPGIVPRRSEGASAANQNRGRAEESVQRVAL